MGVSRELIAGDCITPLPFPTTCKTNDKTCVICISDTHNSKPPLPDGEILLHAGDLSQYGLVDEIQAQTRLAER